MDGWDPIRSLGLKRIEKALVIFFSLGELGSQVIN